MKGYLNSPEETAATFWNAGKRHEDGWLRTGDIGIMDENAYIAIVDRLKDLIITGGENVFPREVEEALYTVPEVQECAVIGQPDKEWGKARGRLHGAEARLDHRAGQDQSLLEGPPVRIQVPKQIVVIDEFPKSQAGKVPEEGCQEAVLVRKKARLSL